MKPTEYRNKKWNSLSDFKEWLTKTNKEDILEFDGFQLITNKGIYGLFDSQLRFTEQKK